MKRNSGFSLIEVMCAILILGFGLVGLTQGINTALLSSKESEIQTAAAFLAAGQIETLRAEGYVVDGEFEGEGEGELSMFAWTQSVVETELEGLYEVTVVVRHSQTGKEIYELKTLLFDPPVIRETETDRSGNERRRL